MSKNCKKTVKQVEKVYKNSKKYRKIIKHVEKSLQNRPKLRKTINKPPKMSNKNIIKNF